MGVPTAPTITGDTSVNASELDTFFTECADIINVESSKGIEASNLSASAGFKNGQKAEPYAHLVLPFNLRPVTAVVQTGLDSNTWRRATVAHIFRIPWPGTIIGVTGDSAGLGATRLSALLFHNIDPTKHKNKMAYGTESGIAPFASWDFLFAKGTRIAPCREDFAAMDEITIALRHDASIAAASIIRLFVHTLVQHQRSG